MENPPTQECVFCKIVNKTEPAHIFWEDEKFMAFLSIFPNTEGCSIVIPKKHYPSYIFDLPDEIICDLMLVSKKIAKLLDSKLDDVARTGVIFEGTGVNHLHAKLIPMHGTSNIKQWTPMLAHVDKYFEKYEGYLSSHDYVRAEDKELEKLARKLRQ